MGNNKGFTLIELLAMLFILGILMAVTVPNITGILNNSKSEMYETDITKMVNKAKVRMTSNSAIRVPKIGECKFFSLEYLDDSDDFKKGPNGGNYLKQESFVIVKKVKVNPSNPNSDSKIEYWFRLVENKNGNYYGVYSPVIEYSDFKRNEDEYLKEITDYEPVFTGVTSISAIMEKQEIKDVCGSSIRLNDFEAYVVKPRPGS